MNNLWSPFVNQLTPYVPGEQPAQDGVVKLNTNENPYPPSPQVIQAINSVAGDELRLYPDPVSARLRQVIADYHSSESLQIDSGNIFVGNGSDEVLGHAFNAFFRKPDRLLFPDITYSFYPVYCRLFGIDYHTVELDQEFCVRIEDYSQPPCGGVILANPNAPTGRLLELDKIARIAEQHREAVVLVDEAYIDFVDDERAASAINLVADYENILVTRTLSKSRALAGIRLGYAVGNSALIDALVRVKDSFNSYPVDCIAEAAAIASFGDEAYFQEQRHKVIGARTELVAQLKQRGFSVIPSAANFVMASPGACSAGELAAVLRERNIIVRYFNKPKLENFLRITIGDAAQNSALLSAFDDFLV